jgi:hypothetical protein
LIIAAPEVGSMKFRKRLIVDVSPAPFAPSRQKASPGSIFRLSESSAAAPLWSKPDWFVCCSRVNFEKRHPIQRSSAAATLFQWTDENLWSVATACCRVAYIGDVCEIRRPNGLPPFPVASAILPLTCPWWQFIEYLFCDLAQTVRFPA